MAAVVEGDFVEEVEGDSMSVMEEVVDGAEVEGAEEGEEEVMVVAAEEGVGISQTLPLLVATGPVLILSESVQ